MDFEYKVIPAPTKGRKQRGVRKPDDRFALAIQETMNEMAVLGWEFIRSETLPNTERTGLTRKTTTERTLLVFRRATPAAAPTSSLQATLRDIEKPKPQPAPPNTMTAPEPVAEPPVAEPAPETAPAAEQVAAQSTTVVPLPNAAAAQAKTAEVAMPEPRQDVAGAPDPRPKIPSRPQSQALYTKDVEKPEKRSKINALPAALRSRASQSQDGKKA